MFHNEPEKFTDPNITYPIYNDRLHFSDYIDQCKTIIRQHRVDLGTNTDLIIEANSPFELRPSPSHQKIRCGVLLIHGLLDCPFIMKDIGKHLQSQGMLVRAILLPGHGTVPGALLNTHYEEWIQAVRYGVSTFANQVDTLFIGGFSTGATLALDYALQHPTIAGLLFICPAFKIATLACIAHWHRLFSRLSSRAKWFYIAKEDNYTKYESIPYNAAYQVYQLAKKVMRQSALTPPQCPLFTVAYQQDLTVKSAAIVNYFKHYATPQSRLLLYSNKRIRTHDPRILLRTTSYPALKIKKFSHVAMPIAPSNPHYGMEGDYKSHILLFNPDFEYMMQEMDLFLKAI